MGRVKRRFPSEAEKQENGRFQGKPHQRHRQDPRLGPTRTARESRIPGTTYFRG